MVTSDSIASQLPDSYDALQASTAEPTPASHIGETCCKTFAPKGTPASALRSDQITRMWPDSLAQRWAGLWAVPPSF